MTPTSSWWDRVRAPLLKVGSVGLSTAAWPSEALASRVILGFIAAWGVVTFWALVNTGHFTFDQAYFWEQSLEVARRLRLPAYGPFVSGVSPSPQTPGGSLFVVLSVPFFLFTDPRVGLLWIHLLAAAGAWLFDRALVKLGVAPAARMATMVLYLASATHARASETFWNGDLFLFITPALMALAAHVVTTDAVRPWPFFLMGLTGGLSVQTHLSGAMGLALSVALMVLLRPKLPRWWQLALVPAGFVATYLPYVVQELTHGMPNTQLLKGAIPQGGFSREAIWQSLLSPVLYVSHGEWAGQLWLTPPGDDWAHTAGKVTLVVGALLALFGLAVQHRLKLFSLAVLAGLPAYFRLSGRGYFDHYVITVVPFAVLFAGAGLGWLLARPGVTRRLAQAYLVLYVAWGLGLLVAQQHRPVLHPNMPWNGMTVEKMLEGTKQRLAAGRPIPSGPGDELAYVYALLARHVLRQELYFDVGGRRCTAQVALSGFGEAPPRGPTVPLSNNTVFVCE